MDIEQIRNFSIIAHIDHGKTTLSDRLLHRTGTISDRDMENQLLDSMDLEKERGITIKAHPVTMYYTAADGVEYELNLIDTPGHVDFSYEVSRSLSACEGALLIVDAAQGVEAQTVANVNLAHNQNLAIIPVINKIDLPHADVDGVKRQLEEILAIPADDAVLASAKEGIGTEAVLEAVVKHVPPPKKTDAPSLQALVFDSYFDSYRGVVAMVRVFNGHVRAGMNIKMLHSDKTVEVKEVGSFNPKPYKRDALVTGETGYLSSNIKSPSDVKIGDTLTEPRNPSGPLPGFKELKPMVFSGIYPINPADYEHLRPTWPSCNSTTRLFFTRRRVPSRLASVSVAGSSACCTLRSYRSGCGASSTWTSSPPIPAWFTGWSQPVGRRWTSTTRFISRSRILLPPFPSRWYGRTSCAPMNTLAT